MAEERIAAGEPVPGAGIQPGDARRDLGDDLGFAVGHTLSWVGAAR